MPDVPLRPGRVLLFGVGAGVRAAGDYLLNAGVTVEAFDDAPDSVRDWCRARDVPLHRSLPLTLDRRSRLGQSWVRRRFDYVLHSAAVDPGRVGRTLAISYPAWLGQLSRSRPTLAIAGTHGKSSTVAMLAYLLPQAGVIGGVEVNGRSGRVGDVSQPLIVEACEFRRHFHELTPQWLAILNIDFDHPDCYTNRDDVVAAFAALAARVPEGKTIYHAGDLPEIPSGRRVVTLRSCKQPDEANRAAAATIARDLGLSDATIAERLATLPFIPLRMERQDAGEVVWYGDYAHHPRAVAATLRTLRDRHAGRPLLVVFEPHQLRRLREFGPAFVDALRVADHVVLAPVFEARESNSDTDRERAWQPFAEVGVRCRDFDAARQVVRQAIEAEPGAVVVAMGAGCVHQRLAALRRELQTVAAS